MNQPLRSALRVVIVDDHEVVREGLRALFSGRSNLCVVGEAGSIADALAVVRDLQPDVVVLDYRLEDGSGALACRQILAERPRTRVVILTAYADEVAAAAALRAGAAGFLVKHATGDSLVRAVEGCASEAMVDADLLRRVACAEIAARQLDEQDRVLAGLVAQGLTNTAIAARLGAPEATVKSRISRLLARLGVSSRSELCARLADMDRPRDP